MKDIISSKNANTIPDEYIDYVLCNHFHCLPSELDKQDDYLISVFLEIISLQNKEERKQLEKMKKINRQ